MRCRLAFTRGAHNSDKHWKTSRYWRCGATTTTEARCRRRATFTYLARNIRAAYTHTYTINSLYDSIGNKVNDFDMEKATHYISSHLNAADDDGPVRELRVPKAHAVLLERALRILEVLARVVEAHDAWHDA